MLVDTGAQITLISETLAEELSLEHVQNAHIIGVTGTAQGWIGRLPKLRLGTKEVNNLNVMVGSLPGIHPHFLGMDVLERLKLSVGLRNLQQSRP
jgi:predicted aspartyl protease